MNAQQELAKYKSIRSWSPKIGDFVIYHALFWTRWYGIISEINGQFVTLTVENLPKLLLTMTPEEQIENKKTISIARMQGARGGSYAIMQDGVWHIDG
ncbi:hypothetical protein LCGC14_2990720 [marine sediment metagenome]|uniref:Uncharacterized protein n=1 Tax=marine sediment metagenome TaxID=412755 RepID=A0A0F8X3U8_9ZZZZ